MKANLLAAVLGVFMLSAGPAAAFRVVDSAGRTVGENLGPSNNEPGYQVGHRTESGDLVRFLVSRNEIIPDYAGLYFFHLNADCSDPRLIEVTEVIRTTLGQPDDNGRYWTQYYAAGAVQTQTILAMETPDDPQHCSTIGGIPFPDSLCCTLTSGVLDVGVAATLDVGAFTPPFTME
jgi:hypothetical protein